MTVPARGARPRLGSPNGLEWALSQHVLTAVAPATRDEPVLDGAPLRGMTATVKDVWDLVGTATRAGTRFLPDTPAIRDAALVARLRERGARVIAKTAMSELAFSVLGENDAVPAPANPHDPARVCGGSSSGAGAGVTTGVCDVAFGTDSGGSVRLPAAWCGTIGVKPTQGVIPAGGALTFAPSLDTVGLLTTTVRAAVTTLAALTDLADLTGSRAGPPTLIELTPPPWAAPTAEIADITARGIDRLRRAGLLAAARAPWNPLTACHRIRRRRGTSLAAIEGAQGWAPLVRDAADASPRLRAWAHANGAHTTEPAMIAALRRDRAELIAAFAAHTPPGTVYVLPASPIPPPTFAALRGPATYPQLYARAHALLWPFNELDAPAVCLPCGHTSTGLPVALQLAAPRGRDRAVLAAALAAESALSST